MVATSRGLAPAWIAMMPSMVSSIWSHSRSLIRLSRLAIGSHRTLALSTPHSVATNAPAMRWPSFSGSLRFSSTWIRPMTVPMMPIVGA